MPLVFCGAMPLMVRNVLFGRSGRTKTDGRRSPSLDLSVRIPSTPILATHRAHACDAFRPVLMTRVILKSHSIRVKTRWIHHPPACCTGIEMCETNSLLQAMNCPQRDTLTLRRKQMSSLWVTAVPAKQILESTGTLVLVPLFASFSLRVILEELKRRMEPERWKQVFLPVMMQRNRPLLDIMPRLLGWRTSTTALIPLASPFPGFTSAN